MLFIIRKIKCRALVFGMLLSIFAGANQSDAFASSSNFLNGLALYSDGNVEESYEYFENAFAEEGLSEDQYVSIAKILSFAPNSMLKIKKRHDYALFYLEHESPELLGTEAVNRLWKIIGDSSFECGALDRAAQYYGFMFHDSDLRNQAYATYRLGWIDLNHQLPKNAFLNWYAFIEKSGFELEKIDSDLLRSIIRDLGRTWAEAVESAYGTGVIEEYYRLIGNSKVIRNHEAELIDGVVMGMKRFTNEDLVEVFKKELINSGYASKVFALLLQKVSVFKNFPCSVMSWVGVGAVSTGADDAPEKKFEQEYFMILNSCAKKIVEQKHCEDPEGTKFQEFYDRASLQTKWLPSRISLSVSCNRHLAACRDLLQLAANTAEEKSQKLAEADFKPLIESCTNALDPEEVEKEKASGSTITPTVKAAFVKLLITYAEKGFLGSESVTKQSDPFFNLAVAFLNASDVRTQVIQQMTEKVDPKTAEKFAKTFLPSLVVRLSSEAERETYGKALFDAYARRPVKGTWLNLLKAFLKKEMKEKNSESVRNLLKEFLPLDASVAKDEESSKVWEFFWLEVEPATASDSEAVKSWFKLLPINKLNADRKKRAVAVALKFDQLDTIWNQWSLYQPVVKGDAQIRAAFFKRTLALMSKEISDKASSKSQDGAQEKSQNKPQNEPSINISAISKTKEGKLLVRVSQKDATLSAGEVKALLGDDLPIFDDLKNLDKVKSIVSRVTRQRLVLNGFFADELKRKLKNIQDAEKIIRSIDWSSPKFSAQAGESFRTAASSVISQVEGIKKEAGKKEGFAELVSQLDEIIGSVSKQIETIDKFVKGEK